jgi:hypothetical protein
VDVCTELLHLYAVVNLRASDVMELSSSCGELICFPSNELF